MSSSLASADSIAAGAAGAATAAIKTAVHLHDVSTALLLLQSRQGISTVTIQSHLLVVNAACLVHVDLIKGPARKLAEHLGVFETHGCCCFAPVNH
jgi:hypothetical protein